MENFCHLSWVLRQQRKQFSSLPLPPPWEVASHLSRFVFDCYNASPQLETRNESHHNATHVCINLSLNPFQLRTWNMSVELRIYPSSSFHLIFKWFTFDAVERGSFLRWSFFACCFFHPSKSNSVEWTRDSTERLYRDTSWYDGSWKTTNVITFDDDGKRHSGLIQTDKDALARAPTVNYFYALFPFVPPTT